MNIRLLLCIAMGVFVIHIGVVMLIAEFRPKPPWTPPPAPNFTVRSAVFTDAATGEKMVSRELTVSTKFSIDMSTPLPKPTPKAIPAAGAAGR